MTCIIVDDDLMAREILKQLCSEIEDLVVLGEFDNAGKAVSFLTQNAVDLVFLDIMLPVLNGFEILESSGTSSRVILTTSHSQFALKSYEYENVVDYLVKPIKPKRFLQAISNLRKRIRHEDITESTDTSSSKDKGKEFIYVNIDRHLIQVPIDQILFVEAQRDYVHIQTIRRIIRVHTSLKAIREKLGDERFLQIHRSFLVNTDYISDVKSGHVYVKSYVLPLSRGNRPALMEHLNRA